MSLQDPLQISVSPKLHFVYPGDKSSPELYMKKNIIKLSNHMSMIKQVKKKFIITDTISDKSEHMPKLR